MRAVPVWAALLIALATGLLGVLARIVHDRGAEVRGRMLDAADEFLAATIAGLDQLNEVGPTVLSRGMMTSFLAKPLDAGLANLDSIVKDLRLRLARVELLFGTDSPAAQSAKAIANDFRDSTSAIVFLSRVSSQGPEADAMFKSLNDDYNKRILRLWEVPGVFSQQARDEVAPWWRRRWSARPTRTDG